MRTYLYGVKFVEEFRPRVERRSKTGDSGVPNPLSLGFDKTLAVEVDRMKNLPPLDGSPDFVATDGLPDNLTLLIDLLKAVSRSNIQDHFWQLYTNLTAKRKNLNTKKLPLAIGDPMTEANEVTLDNVFFFFTPSPFIIWLLFNVPSNKDSSPSTVLRFLLRCKSTDLKCFTSIKRMSFKIIPYQMKTMQPVGSGLQKTVASTLFRHFHEIMAQFIYLN